MKPQTQQSGRLLSLAQILAAGSLIIVDMAQMPATFERSLQMEFNTYLTHSEGFGVVFMKHMKGSRDVNIKKNKCGSDYLGVFGVRALERLCMHNKHTVLQ